MNVSQSIIDKATEHFKGVLVVRTKSKLGNKHLAVVTTYQLLVKEGVPKEDRGSVIRHIRNELGV